MSSTFRPRRVALSAVNSPTVAHIRKASTLEKGAAESFLTEFIEASEINAGKANGSISSDASSNTGMSSSTEGSAVLSQLRRIQRDLRGLPPLAVEAPINNAVESKKTKFDDNDTVSDGPKNKKIKFDDSESESGMTEKNEDEESDVAEENAEEDGEQDKNVTNVEENIKESTEVSKEEKKSKNEKKNKKEKKVKKDKKEKKDKKKSKSD